MGGWRSEKKINDDNSMGSWRLKHLRMKEVFKKPSTEDCNSIFWQPSYWPPCLLGWNHSQMLGRCSFLSGILIKQAKLAKTAMVSQKVFWETSSCSTYLCDYCMFQTAEVPGHSLECKTNVRLSRPYSSNHLKWWHHFLHLMTILLLSSVDLEGENHIDLSAIFSMILDSIKI